MSTSRSSAGSRAAPESGSPASSAIPNGHASTPPASSARSSAGSTSTSASTTRPASHMSKFSQTRSDHQRRVLAPSGQALRRSRHPGPGAHHRQWPPIPLEGARDRLPNARDPPPCAPAPTGPRPTEKPSDSSAPCSPAGPTARPTAPQPNAPPRHPAGSTSTIATDHTAISHQPPLTRLQQLSGNNLLGSYS